MKLSESQLLAMQKGSLGPFGDFVKVTKIVFCQKILKHSYFQREEANDDRHAITDPNKLWPNNIVRFTNLFIFIPLFLCHSESLWLNI